MKDLYVNGKVVTLESLAHTMRSYDLPPYMIEGVFYYLVHHLEPGSFLMSLFSNDLKNTIRQADDINGRRIKEWLSLMYNEFPSGSWGSEKKVQEWLAQREKLADERS
jgi:hypothetical protein